MNRTFRSTLFLTAACLAFPVAAQTPPTQAWPQNRPPAQATPPAQPAQPAAPPSAGAAATPPAAGGPLGAPAPVPLPQWFVDIDVNKKGEVTRADFLKYRMKSFEALDANKDNSSSRSSSRR